MPSWWWRTWCATRGSSTGEQEAFSALIVKAVDEVGNPTILATLTVIAAILPMAFVGGLMGPYMRPIPVGATAAMVFSLIVAFVATPWAAKRLLTEPAHHDHGQEDRLTVLYRRWMGRLIVSPRARAIFLGSVAAMLLGAVALIPLKLVTVKMLPFDNKSEFQVIVNMPEGTPLEDTARVTARLARETLRAAVGDERPELRRVGVAVQLQRPRAPLLPPPGAPPGRPAGEPAPEGGAVRAEPRDRQARARGARCRWRPKPAPGSRWRRCRRGRRCCRRSWPRCTAPTPCDGSKSPGP